MLWGSFSVTSRYTWGLGSPFVAHTLSFGLVRLLAILNANTYDTRCRLLGGDTPKRNSTFLQCGHSSADITSLRCLADFTEQDKERFARLFPPFVEESDTGPADAWRWAYQGENCQNFSYSNYRIPLLQQGYCMWDSSRLDAWRIFAHPWHRSETPRPDSSTDCARGNVQWQSWRARLLIYEDGGRGWWSLGDESKIVWPPGGKVKHEERTKGKPWRLGGKAREEEERREIDSRLLQRAR